MDHRFLHAIFDNPARAIPDLARFAAEDHENDPYDLEEVLADIFRHLAAPEAIPFYMDLIRRDPLNVSDELVESMVRLGSSAVDPLLQLLAERSDQDPGDLAFVLASLNVRDSRILDVLVRRLDEDVSDAALSLEIYGDPAALPALQAALAGLPAEDLRQRQMVQSAIDVLSLGPKSLDEAPGRFDIWTEYAEKDAPDFDAFSEQDRLEMLASGSAEIRTAVAASYSTSEIPLTVRARLLELAKADPDVTVRRACWEALEDLSDEPEVRRTMLAVVSDPQASLDERAGATIALARHSDDATVVQAIENLYQDSRGRAAALKAMARSMDRRFAGYPARHLDDPDPEIKNQAIWATGYLNLSSEAPRLEAFFHQEKHRTPALFAYSLASPGETSRGRVRALLEKIENLAGGLDADETDLVRLALDQRLMLHGHKPAFFTEESEEEQDEAAPAAASKVGRNDPCPCGSGKKYKKCCGA